MKPRRSPFVSFAGLALALFAGCFNEAKAPTVPPSATLSVPSDLGSVAAETGPVAVVATSMDPVGVVFDRPMRQATAELRAIGSAGPSGKWTWIGQRALVFSPDRGALPLASDYELTVPAGAASMDGASLGAPYRARFATPRPALVALDPSQGAITQTPAFQLRFNQPTSLDEVQSRAHLYAGENETRRQYPLRAARPDGAATDTTRVTLLATDPLPSSSPVELVLDGALRGTEGPLPMGRAETYHLRTHGALAVVAVRRSLGKDRGRCSSSSLELELSNPVSVSELAAHVRLEPRAAIDWNRSTTATLTRVDVRAALDPMRSYDLVVSAGMKDIYGGALAAAVTRRLEPGPEPLLRIGEREIFPAEGPGSPPTAVIVRAGNIEAYDLLVQPLDETMLERYFAQAAVGATDPLAEASRLFPQAKVVAVHLPAPGSPEARSLPLNAVLAAERGHGAVLIVTETQGPTRSGAALHDVRVITRTDLRLSARVGVRGTVVWVDRFSDHRPVAGAVISLRDGSGAEVGSGRTDESGMAVLPVEARSFSTDAGVVDPRALLVARAGEDWSYRPMAEDAEDRCREPAPGAANIHGVLVTDRVRYELGDSIFAKVLFREDRREDRPPVERTARITLTSAAGDLVGSALGKLDAYGGFDAELRVPSAEEPGPWLVRAAIMFGEQPAAPVSESVWIVDPGAGPPPRGEPRAGEALPGAGLAKPSPDDAVSLVPDASRYRVGETATVQVRSTFHDAEAFAVTEGTGVPTGERMAVSGPTATLRVPVTDDLIPGGRLSVLLASSAREAPGVDPILVGGVPIPVDPASHRLKVAIVPLSASPAPGGTLDADVLVTDQAGQPVRASVTLWAVDGAAPRAIDPLTALEAPAPVASYWIHSRADAEDRAVPRGARVSVPTPPSQNDEATDSPATTVLFDGRLLTDVSGRAHARLRIPTASRGLELAAIAASLDSRFGFSRAMLDTRPLLGVEIEEPSIVRAGDSFELRAAITSRGSPRTATVTLASIGADVAPRVPQSVAVPADGRVELRWVVRALEVGKAQVVVTARSGDQVSQASMTRGIEDPSELEDVVTYGEATDASAERLGPWGNARGDDGLLELKVSATPLVGLDDGIEQILRFPYADTEQHATRLIALSGLPELLRDFGVALPEPGTFADRETQALLEAQRPDGTFDPWPGAADATAESRVWRSAYALWALNLALMHGRPVPERATSLAASSLKQSLAGWNRSPREGAEAAFALDVLADLGLAEGDKMQPLFEARAHLPLFARALLAHAMTVEQMDDEKIGDLLGDLESHLRTTAVGSIVVEEPGREYAPLHESPARSTAMVLRALVARAKGRAPNVFRKVRPSDLTVRIAKGLLSMRHGGVWRTPEETAWALRALEDFRAAHVLNHPDLDALFYLDETLLSKLPLHDRRWQSSVVYGMRKALGAGAVGKTLGFRVEGDGKVAYETRLRYAPAAEPAVDRGFAVEKRFVPLENASPRGAGEPRSGQEVAVELWVASAAAHDQVVIDDPLPGGLTSPSRETRSPEISRVEKRDDRVVVVVDHLPAGLFRFRYVARAGGPGRYVVPATRVTCLYEPEAFGRTARSELAIRE